MVQAVPSQSPNPNAHWNPHTPAVQFGTELGGAGHTLEQRPQFITSLLVLVQADGQSVIPGMAGHTQLPLTHDEPGLQTLPHPPQWFGSVANAVASTHPSAHKIEPLGHSHCPLVQTDPSGQTRAHPPQWAAFDVTSTHEPPPLPAPAHHTREPEH
jgi:hypothetical protein